MDIFWLWIIAFLCVDAGLVVGISYARRTASVASLKSEYRQRQKAIAITNKRLDEIRQEYAHDLRQLHSHADGCVAGLLLGLGCVEVVDKWEELILRKGESDE